MVQLLLIKLQYFFGKTKSVTFVLNKITKYHNESRTTIYQLPCSGSLLY